MINQEPPDNPPAVTTINVGAIGENPQSLLKQTPYNLQDYNPRKKHDEVRARISYILLIFLGSTLFLSFASLFWTFYLKDQATAWGDAKDLLEVVIPTLTTLVGSIVGFYFGSQSQNETKQ